MRRYGSIDEIAKEYALTNEQLLDYLLSNDIDAISDLDKIDLKTVKSLLRKTSSHSILLKKAAGSDGCGTISYCSSKTCSAAVRNRLG